MRLLSRLVAKHRGSGYSDAMDRRQSDRYSHAWRLGAAMAPVVAAALTCGSARAQTSPVSPPVPSPVLAPVNTSVDTNANNVGVMDDMPNIGVAWPDLGADDLPPIAMPTAEIAPVVAEGSTTVALPDAQTAAEMDEATKQAERLSTIDPSRPVRYEVKLIGVDDIADDLFHTRFDALSELQKGAGDLANIAQITRRAKTDVDLVDKLARTRGYYNARIAYQLLAPENSGQRLIVELDTQPGTLYKLKTVSLTGLSTVDPKEEALRTLFTVKPGDPADTDVILAATDKVRVGLAEGGYPFGKVDEPVLRVDHDARDAALDVMVAAGGFKRYGQIIVMGDPPFDAEHIADIARFHPGDPYKLSQVEDLDRALISTGLTGSVDITPKPGAAEETVDLMVAMTKAPPRTVAGEIGYGTGEGARVELSWEHRNLFPPEGALTLRGVLGVDEQSASATFRRSNWKQRDHALNGQLAFSHINQAAYQARTVTLSGNIERLTNIIFQKKWTWSAGGELILSDERDFYGASLTPRRRTYFIAAAPLTLAYDGSDDLLDPTRGFRLSGRLSPEVSLQNTTFGYVRAQVDGSAYLPMGDSFTLAGRVRLGTIVGASADRIAPTRRFYAGGGGSVRGYAYQAIGPRDLNNDPTGGRSLTELSVEARFRFGSTRQFGLVPFVDAGTISSDALPTIREMRVGAGLGLRYYSNFGPIRIDVGTPINPQPGDPKIGVYVSLGQAF